MLPNETNGLTRAKLQETFVFRRYKTRRCGPSTPPETRLSRRLRSRFSELAVEPGEIVGLADPHDTRKDMEPAQREVNPFSD